jgi:3-oxoadipate CoA-transferase alpha subunit
VINKFVGDVDEAVSGIQHGSTILISGFGDAGTPFELLDGLIRQGASDLIVVSNNAGSGERGIAELLRLGRVRRVVCSFPRSPGAPGENWFERCYREGSVELELVPQGTLAERMRAGGAGIPGFFTPTGFGTALAEGKEVRDFGGRPCVLEHAIRGDVALIGASSGDRWGNLTYRKTARNYGPVMATAAALTVAQIHQTVELGALDPECIVTPGIFVDRVVRI